MKHTTAILLALIGLAAAAPAQSRLDVSLGRHVQIRVENANHFRVDRVGDHRRVRHDRHYHGDHGRHGHRHHGHHGRWHTETYRVWVDGYWQECGGFGHRFWVPGHYETRTRTIWVRC
jgi:hypothetical protein